MDDNVIQFPTVIDPEGTPEFHVVRNVVGPCGHGKLILDEKLRAVQCRACEATLDPFDVLMNYADLERRWRSWHKETSKERRLVKELKKEEKRVKARLRNARERLKELGMNYYEARQRQNDKRWDFTKMNDGQVMAVGYCRKWSEWPNEFKEKHKKSWEEYEARKDEHHADGHETREEAGECYKRYLLDTSLMFNEMTDQQRKCVVCEAWTSWYADVNHGAIYNLCDKHRNREEVEKLFAAPYQITSSY